jgi:hypothetical protein
VLGSIAPVPTEPNPLPYLEGLIVTYMWVRSHISVRVVPLQYCRGDSSGAHFLCHKKDSLLLWGASRLHEIRMVESA